jgi:hypothetical protein
MTSSPPVRINREAAFQAHLYITGSGLYDEKLFPVPENFTCKREMPVIAVLAPKMARFLYITVAGSIVARSRPTHHVRGRLSVQLLFDSLRTADATVSGLLQA